jgi:hypothetical protein
LSEVIYDHDYGRRRALMLLQRASMILGCLLERAHASATRRRMRAPRTMPWADRPVGAMLEASTKEGPA